VRIAAGQRADVAAAARLVVFGNGHAAVEVNPDRVGARRIVVRRHVEPVEELDVTLAEDGADDAGGDAAGVGTAGLQPGQRGVERNAARGDLLADGSSGCRRRCRPQTLEERVSRSLESRQRSLRRKR